MIDDGRRTIVLKEYIESHLPATEITHEEGESIWRTYGEKIDVEFPSPPTGNHWVLRSRGWVGSIPLSHDLLILLEPKVPIGNLFRMLEYAYDLKSFQLLEGTIDCASLEDLHARLASILARRVLARHQRGLYREYVPEEDRLPYVRGAIDLRSSIRAPWSVGLHCRFEEHTADIEENRILAWTLNGIARSGICTGQALETVRTAYRGLHGHVRTEPVVPGDCIGRLYNRLNEDYRPLHALCRFFLEQRGPAITRGEWEMIPFLVDMARLYELFVARWLESHLPERYALIAQESVDLDPTGKVNANIDLVIYDRTTAAPVAILDTKYKTPAISSHDDLHQIVAYASAKGCGLAMLIYPVPLAQPFNSRFGASSVMVRTLTFGLGDALEERGEKFLAQLLSAICSPGIAEVADGLPRESAS